MLVHFRIGLGSDQYSSEWVLDAVPRQGDWVSLGRDGAGTVRSVLWIFADDDGKPLKQPYAQVVAD